MAVQDAGWADLRTPEGCDEAVCVVLGDDAGLTHTGVHLPWTPTRWHWSMPHRTPSWRSPRAAAQGWTMLPTDTARTMASGHETGESLGPALAQEERGWIEMLAAGTTVHAVARAVGRSERTMFRLLHELSHRMGVSNRMEAVRASSRSPSERPLRRS